MRYVPHVFAFSILLAACQTGPTQTSAPLPDDINIQQPASNVSEEKAAFLGQWHGRWGGTLDGKLVVESVSNETAEVIYAWGTSQYVQQSGWKPVTGQFQDATLVVPLNENPSVVARYTMTERGKLDATYRDEGDDVTSEATFVKVGSN